MVVSVLGLISLATTDGVRGQRVIDSGGIWLKWGQKERLAYAYGFNAGYDSGYVGACRLMIDAWPPPRTDDPAGKCQAGELNFIGIAEYVDMVTELYRRYPEDREIGMDEIFEQLAKGLTIEQVHHYPFPRHNPPAEKPQEATNKEPDVNQAIEQTIARIRTETSWNSADDPVLRLAELTEGIKPNSVRDTTLTDMISLLEDRHDSVIAWVAAALGNLGPRAQPAIPKLLALLPAADCLKGDLTSAPFMRSALERIGQKPPPTNKDCGQPPANSPAAEEQPIPREMVRGSATAIEIARLMLTPIYGKSFVEHKLFSAARTQDDWVVAARPKAPHGQVVNGGVIELHISAADGRVS